MINNKRTRLLCISFIILIILLFMLFLIGNFFIPPYIKNIEIKENNIYKDQNIININVENPFYKLNKEVYCFVSTSDEIPDENNEWVKANNGYCSFSITSGDYNIFVKDKYGNIQSLNDQSYNINKILDIKTNKDIFYMYKGMNDKITYELNVIGNVDKTISFASEDENVVSVDNIGNIKAKGFGTANVILSSNGVKKNIKIVVTNLITTPQINSKKNYISCGQFSEEEANMLDQILFDRINDAGYKTRAGVVAAARFLSLEFSYRIHYFYENGRLNNYSPYLYVDGEGRYYHRGLYLNKNKFNEIKSKFVGPAIWGCDLQNYTDWGPYVAGQYYPNGLDCSGFVTWALLNGGFDIGDIGAGASEEHNDLDDLGKKVYITDELMNSGKVKVGDLIGLNGHMAILAGWDDNYYYVAESLNTTGGVVMTIVAKDDLVSNSIYEYIILMDDVYKEDGNYSTKW